MTTGRAAREWGRFALHVVLLLVGIGLLQVVADRTNRVFDLTPDRSLSLSPITLNVLAEVKDPLAVTVFFRRGTREQYTELLARLRDANPHVTAEVFDLDRYPDRARTLGVTQYGRAAIEYAGRRVVVTALPEAQLAGGILQAVRGRSKQLLFTTGHGERRPGGDAESYGRLVSALAAENYTADGVSLLDGAIAEDTALLVIAGPRHDFLATELEVLGTYLKAGGAVLMLLDPVPLPNLSRFLASMGIRVGDDLIVDHEKRVLGTDGLAAVVELFKRGNPVSDPGANPIETGVVLPSARTVDVGGEVAGVLAESIARTSPTAWVVADPARARRGEEPSEGMKDQRGPASVVVIAEVGSEGNGTRGRLVVVGDADFASDAYLDLLGNRDIVMNAVAWLAAAPPPPGPRSADVPEIQRPLSPLVLTTGQARRIFVAGVIAEPLLVLLTGLVVVGLRRRKG
jgi:ABC-type uncharacterized transport system involved in gliding motility auxiliary subunit